MRCGSDKLTESYAVSLLRAELHNQTFFDILRIRIEYGKEGVMQKKLTITVEEQVYEGLYRVVGRRNISQFINSLLRPHVLQSDLEAAYSRMAANELREAEALEWVEATIGDVKDETR